MAALDAYKNLAIAQILTPPAPAASGTSLTLMAGQGAYLPAVPFNATIFPGNLFPNPVNAEIVRVTARATDVLTITRAQEASTARTVLAGDYLAASFTEKFVADLRDSSNQNAGTLPDARLSSNVALKNSTNVFTALQQIAMLRPDLQLQYTGDTAKGHLQAGVSASLFLMENLSYDGTNWQRDDVTKPGVVVSLTSGQFGVSAAPAGANPVGVLAPILLVTATGDVSFPGSLTGGTIPDARLSSNIPKLNAANVFTTSPQELGAILALRNTGAPADARLWRLIVGSDGALSLAAQNDAATINAAVAILSRLGTLTLPGDLVEKGRLTPMGHWIDFTPAVVAQTGTISITVNYTTRYMLVGKTCTVAFFWDLTLSATPAQVTLTLPASLSATHYMTAPMQRGTAGAVVGSLMVVAGGASLYLSPDISQVSPFPTGAQRLSGTITFSIP